MNRSTLAAMLLIALPLSGLMLLSGCVRTNPCGPAKAVISYDVSNEDKNQVVFRTDSVFTFVSDSADTARFVSKGYSEQYDSKELLGGNPECASQFVQSQVLKWQFASPAKKLAQFEFQLHGVEESKMARAYFIVNDTWLDGSYLAYLNVASHYTDTMTYQNTLYYGKNLKAYDKTIFYSYPKGVLRIGTGNLTWVRQE